jgi:hypothetical protein
MEISDQTFYETLGIMRDYLIFLENKKEEEKSKIMKLRNENSQQSTREEASGDGAA